jgi:gliding motility-associated-like protein
MKSNPLSRLINQSIFILIFSLLASTTTVFGQVSVEYNLTAEELSESITGDGVQILNPVLACADSASGSYQITDIPGFIDGTGIILTTGNVANIFGPNDTEASTTVNGFPGDPIVTQITGNTSFDACVLEFDVVPVGDTLEFNFTFASEEYDEYVGTPFNDFFGFFISGPGIPGDPGLDGLENIAVVPNTNTPVGINSINGGNPDLGVPPSNQAFYVSNPLGFSSPIQYDAWTRGLSAVREVTPCDTFSVKLVIADAADPEWDSAVLIEAISSSSVSLTQTTDSGLESTIEGCNNGTVTFTRSPITDEELEVTFFVNGTATNGVDYEQIGDDPDPAVPKTLTIPANQASVSIDIIPFDDGEAEGEEYIDFFIGNPNCVGTVQDSIRVLINDSINVSIDPPLAFVCLGNSLTFDVEADPNATFTWSPTDFLNDPSLIEPTTTPTGDIDYTLTVTAGSCESVALTEVRVSDVELAFEEENINCAGDNNGSIDMTISGGQEPYEIQWSGPAGFSSIEEDIDNLAPGTYVVLVIDRDGCSQSGSVVISENDALEITVSSPAYQGGFNVSCAEANDGEATAEVIGGVPPYSFSWNDASLQTTATATNLPAGTYEVTVTDANNCITIETITLTAPAPITAELVERIDVSCNGEPTGEATISPIGGVAPYTIVWNTVPPQFGPTATGLAAGFYTASITDVNGCQGTNQVEIAQPDSPVSGSVSVTSVSCNGESNGSATATIEGGTPPYTYSWSSAPDLNEPSIDELAAGSYSLLVIDDNGCELSIPFTITQPTALTLSVLSEENPSCNGFDDGELSVIGQGGTQPYTYSWNTDPVQTTPSISGLAPGSYTVTVSDANGCTTEQTFELTEPEALTVGLINLEDPTCSGFNDGSIEVEAIGGTSPYSISWNTIPASTTGLIENLGEGSYTVTITDANGCVASETYTLTEPSPLDANIESIQNVLCAGESTGSVTIAVSGGTPDYTVEWDDPSNQTGLTATNLAAGTYTASIEDANGCTITFQITITEPANPLAATITSQTDVLCFGDGSGTATVTATGGSGSYSYQWDDPLNQQTATATGLAAGDYTVTVTDNNGCATPIVVSVTIGGPTAELEITLTPSLFGGGFNVACADDSTATIDLAISGGTAPYDILWNLPGLDTSTDANLTDLAPGVYSVEVTDANGCTAEGEITLTAPSEISVESTTAPSLCFGIPSGSIDITISGGVPAYTADWTGPNGFTGSGTSLTDLEGGVYIVTIEDDNGCILSEAVTVVQPDDIIITVDSLSDFNGFNLSCYNSSDGEIYITPSGGTPPYDYIWNTTGDPNFSNQEDLINLSAGTYEAVVIDDNGCVQNELIDLIAPDTVEVSFNVSEYLNGFNISCFGADDGSVEAVPVTGVTPFSFIWVGSNGFGPVFDNPIEDLPAGEYSVFFEDDNGCSSVATTVLVQPDELDFLLIPEVINGNNISCEGAADGSINLIFEGGTPPISISWTGPNGFTSTDEDLFGLAAGEYCVTLTDDNNCVSQECVTLSEPAALTVGLAPFIYPNGFNLTCEGAGDGEINATIGGGTTPYSFEWNGPAGFSSTSQNIGSLNEGEYCLTVTDANGCSETTCVTLTAPEDIEIVLDNLVNPSCGLDNDGAIDLTIATGEAPFNISWTGPNGFTSTDEDISGLEPGTYCVTVSDVNGCDGEACYEIVAPEELTVSFTTSSFAGGFEIDCNGNQSGSIVTSVDGGTPPFTAAWTGPDGFTSSDLSLFDLGAGTYCLDLVDDNGCVFNGCVDIEEPTPLAIDPLITLPDCGDGTLAEVDLQIDGGTPPYVINWSNGGDTEVISLDEGSYTVVITDQNNCTIQESIDIDLPATLELGFDIPVFPGGVNIDCNGASTGSIDLSVIGASGSVTISWTGPDGFVSTDEDLANLAAGEYCVEVTDDLGCFATQCVQLTEPAEISATIDSTPTLCAGSLEGSASIAISGGVPVYTVAWTGPNGFTDVGTSIDGLEAGNYCAEVTDFNGCTETFCIDILSPDPIVIDLTSPETDGVNIFCFGENTGEITTAITGGTPDYNYAWTGPDGFTSTQTSLSNLFAGEYCLTITDANGCEETQCITLTQSEGIDFTFDVFEYPNGFNVSCAVECDGSIDLSISGGAEPITFEWTGPPGFSADTEDLSDLCPGAYNVTTTDADGCVQTAGTVILSPPPIIVSLDSPVFGGGLEISCFGENTGVINSTVTGGVGELTYLWIGPNGFTSEEPNLSELFAGTYNLTVTDEGGCAQTATITLSEPEAPLSVSQDVFTYPSGTNISCNGLFDGSISALASGGTAPYGYNWNGPDGFTSTSADIENLPAGDYTLVVIDANECTRTINITLTEPEESLTAALEVNSQILCADSATGGLTVTAAGGSPEYTIQWIGPNDFTSSDFSIGNLLPGTYTYAVTDINGCSVSGAQNLVNPLELTLSEELISPRCENADGSIILTVQGGTSPYDFEWSTGNETQNLENIPAGSYSVTVTDANGCSTTADFELEPNNPLEIIVDDLTDPLCFGDQNGTITVSVSDGVEPIEYSWTGPNDFTSDASSIEGLAPGAYTLSVSDASGCTSSEIYELEEPVELVIDGLDALTYDNGFNLSVPNSNNPDGVIFDPIENTSGGTTPYESILYEGPNGFISTSFGNLTGLAAGFYRVTITDANGCTAQDSITLTQPEQLILPNGISPNGDGFNDGLEIIGLGDFAQNKLTVFNRWGNVVYEEENYSNNAQWIGTNESGEELPEGTYFIVLELNERDNLRGYLELRR